MFLEAFLTADLLIKLLDLRPHPEGGFYRETYRSSLALPDGRSASTAIHYLLVPGTLSKLHRLKHDEVFHFHLGDPVVWTFLAEGGAKKVLLGSGLSEGQQVQMVVPAGTWFGGDLLEGGKYALMGTTVAPGFEFQDFELGDRAKLLGSYPDCREEIIRLT
jgi:predicted cupin superfamily sugar epimerase